MFFHYYFFAAVAFKNAKQFEQAKEAYFKEALSHENNKAYLFIICCFYLK